MSRILKDILTETKNGRTKYSQGRLYLFISFCVFFILNVILAVCAITDFELQDKETLSMISENMRWALGTFGLYVLGGKGIGAFRDRNTGISNDYSHEADYYHYNTGYGHGHGHGHAHGNWQDDETIDPTFDGSDVYHDEYSKGNKSKKNKESTDYYTQGDEEVN